MRNTQKNPEKSSDAPAVPETSLAARILEAQDEERRKIGRELHDSVGQALVAAKMKLAKLKRDQAIADDAGLDEVIEMVDNALNEIRALSHLLHPPDLDVVGLRASLAWYLEGFQQRTGIQAELDVPRELPTLPAAVTTALFRVAQESLTNIHKHAQASQVTLRLLVGFNHLQLEVSDNGKGFADLIACREGVGILGMRERMTELGGSLRVESGHGVGSSVYARVPLGAETSRPIPRKSVPQEERIRVLVVDDHAAIRYGVRTLLGTQPDIVVCGEASDAIEAVERASELRPDVMILDLQLGEINGWAVVRKLRATGLPTKIIVFSHFDERYLSTTAYRGGCSGFVSKTSDTGELIDAIRIVNAGGTCFGSKVLGKSAAG